MNELAEVKEKTHYRKAFNSPYLSSADIAEPVVLTVKAVRYEIDHTKRTKDYFNTVYFEEQFLRPGEKMKPMILNAGNNEIIRGFAGGSKYLDDWILGFKVTIYVDPNVRFGRDTVEGLRISPQAPQTVKPELTLDHKSWGNAVAAYKRDGNCNNVRERMTVSDEIEAKIKEAASV